MAIWSYPTNMGSGPIHWSESHVIEHARPSISCQGMLGKLVSEFQLDQQPRHILPMPYVWEMTPN